MVVVVVGSYYTFESFIKFLVVYDWVLYHDIHVLITFGRMALQRLLVASSEWSGSLLL